MSGYPKQLWRALRSRLRARLGRNGVSTATRVPTWSRLHAIMAAAGHRPSGLVDGLGGYLCVCQQSSWSDLDAYGPYGACPQGWADAREFLNRHGVPEPLWVQVEDGDA